MEDSRFVGKIMKNSDFEIDEKSTAFKMRNPSGRAGLKVDKEMADQDTD